MVTPPSCHVLDPLDPRVRARPFGLGASRPTNRRVGTPVSAARPSSPLRWCGRRPRHWGVATRRGAGAAGRTHRRAPSCQRAAWGACRPTGKGGQAAEGGMDADGGGAADGRVARRRSRQTGRGVCGWGALPRGGGTGGRGGVPTGVAWFYLATGRRGRRPRGCAGGVRERPAREPAGGGGAHVATQYPVGVPLFLPGGQLWGGGASLAAIESGERR